MKEGVKARKPFLIVGIVIFMIGVGIIFPFEYRKSNYIDDLKFTFLTLGIALFTLMYAIMGKHIVKGLFFLIGSALFSYLCWWMFFYRDFWRNIPAIYGGIPSGIITGLVFLIFDYQFIKESHKLKLFLKRLTLYIVLLSIVSLLFAKGGDVIFCISQFIKNR